MFVCVQERDTVELLDEDSQSILNIIKDTSTSHSLLSGESHDNHMTCIYNITCVSCAAPSANNSRSELPTVTSSGAAISNSRVRHTHTPTNTHYPSHAVWVISPTQSCHSATPLIPHISHTNSQLWQDICLSEGLCRTNYPTIPHQ